jgi:hypothetical protein
MVDGEMRMLEEAAMVEQGVAHAGGTGTRLLLVGHEVVDMEAVVSDDLLPPWAEFSQG